MSGVLERMAKRAFGRLTSVQPLIRSIYAASAVSAGEQPRPRARARFVPNERTAAGRAPPLAPELRSPATRAEAPATKDLVAAVTEMRAEPATPPVVREPAERPRVEASAPRPMPPIRHPNPLEQVALTLPDILMREADVPPIVKETNLPPAAGASPEPVRISPALTPSLQRRRVRPVRSESDAPAEQELEIHISIGSIELRTAPAEVKPATPGPFVPRVRLQDFLSRKTERRR